ncbi:hypothetical protein, partial [Thiolapillus sp.]|uniref:hypothetical protein n=1 Tax=Thiolapillus sp. TaxID=2017437 RepID=UPI003AF6DD6A
NSALYSKQLAEQSRSSVLHWILDEATELHANIMSQNSIQVDFPVQKIVLDSSLISSCDHELISELSRTIFTKSRKDFVN